jgi:hypothetical protein
MIGSTIRTHGIAHVVLGIVWYNHSTLYARPFTFRLHIHIDCYLIVVESILIFDLNLWLFIL